MRRNLLIKVSFALLILGYSFWLFFRAGLFCGEEHELRDVFEMLSRVVGGLYVVLSIGILLSDKKSLKAIRLLGILIVPGIIAYELFLFMVGYASTFGFGNSFLIGISRLGIIVPFIPTLLFALALRHPVMKDGFGEEDGNVIDINRIRLTLIAVWVVMAGILVFFFTNPGIGWAPFENAKFGFQVRFPPKWDCRNLCAEYDDCPADVIYCYKEPSCYVKVFPDKITSYGQLYDSGHLRNIDIVRRKTFDSDKVEIIKETIPISNGQAEVTRLMAVEDMTETVKFIDLSPASEKDVLLWKKGQTILDFAEIVVKNNYFYIIMRYNWMEGDSRKCAENHTTLKKIVSTFKLL